MDYLQNHIWCRESIWNGEHYHCRHLVSVKSYGDDKDDWNEIVDEKAEAIDDPEKILYRDYLIEKGLLKEDDDYPIKKNVANFKPHVLDWLYINVKDRKDPDCEKGWCIGSTNYRANDSSMSLTVFFHRKSDAMAFIREFSKYQKPINYCQYFSDVRKQLNLKTMRYKTL